MKNNFKIKLLAIVAVLSGTAIGNCFGMQAASDTSQVTDSATIQATEASYTGPFGAVKPATRISTIEEPEPAFPPIVTVVQARSQQTPELKKSIPATLTPLKPAPSKLVPAMRPIYPPIVQTNPPFDQTNPPTRQTNDAIDQMYPSIDETNKAPIDETNSAIVKMIPSIDPTNPPIVQANPPIDETNPPIDETKATIDETKATIDETKATIDETKATIDETKATIDETKATIDETKATIVQVNPPIDETNPPIVQANPPIIQSRTDSRASNHASARFAPAPEPINRGLEYVESAPMKTNSTLTPLTPTFNQPLPATDPIIPASDPVALMVKQETSPEKKSVMLAPIYTAETPPIIETAEAAIENEKAIPVVQATGEPTEFEKNLEVQQAAQWGQDHLSRGVSAAGVPLYPSSTIPISNLPRIVEDVELPPEMDTLPIAISESPPVPSLGPNSGFVSPIEALIPPTPISFNAGPANLNPGNVMPAVSVPMTPVYRARQDYFEPQPMEAAVISAPGCPKCGNQITGNGALCPSCSTNANCDSCGGSGCSDCGIASTFGAKTSRCPSCGANGCYNPGTITDQFGDCGSVSTARRYLLVEGLYLTRRDGIISNSNFGSLSNFDWAAGLHLTIGNRSDSINGREMSYFGTAEITEGVSHFDSPLGRIDARFIAADGFLPSEISSFKNAVEQHEFKQTELHSLEFNRVEWGWDVVKTYLGLRFLYVEDSYVMNSLNVMGEAGAFEVYVKNNLIGPNWGTEIYYDVGKRLSGTLSARAGLYGNINQVRTKLNNDGTQVLNVEDNNSGVSGTIELGLNGRFKIARRANLRFGYNVMWIGRVAEAANSVPTVIRPTIGAGTSSTNEMQFHGANIGFEIFR